MCVLVPVVAGALPFMKSVREFMYGAGLPNIFFLVRVGEEVWAEGKGCKKKSWSDQPVVWVGVSKKGVKEIWCFFGTYLIYKFRGDVVGERGLFFSFLSKSTKRRVNVL